MHFRFRNFEGPKVSHCVCQHFFLEIDACQNNVVLQIIDYNLGFLREPVSTCQKLGRISMLKSWVCLLLKQLRALCVWSDSSLCDQFDEFQR